ncbi:SufD family Fe-S cluster assembly protein [Candidatus Bipolaricaulota bacterium]|nr:SufD family Fe-S cluster assembly protein [Candidatus Bipolaricaulota bacterium]MBS3814361.1 SufD family Fe-S cluster assembly protein [Candidatus Bipolaricaulota bacterium]MBS3825070.1 SufD family Fe-S cluster assembly protein [Candidatus Bipolaricaulota bacterium]
MDDYQMMVEAYKEAGGEDVFADSEVAHVVLERDNILGAHEVEGLSVDLKNREEGLVGVKIEVKEGYKIQKPVHMCFGVLPEKGVQKIDMEIEVQEEAEVEVMADCVFPSAAKVKHIMNADIHIRKGGSYTYKENHYHGEKGGVEVIANSDIKLEENSYLYTIFSLLEGRVGKIDFDYEAELGDFSTMEMLARMQGAEDDEIKIREAGKLKGRGARGLLDSKIAVQDDASAEILNELTASAPESQGHVDCTEIIKDEAVARAVPIVEVRDPEAKVTHEAAIGSVDDTQLQTLMARGLDKEEASEVIIQGMLND